MTYILIGLGVIIAVLAVTVFLLNKNRKKYKSAYEQEHTKLLDLQIEYSNLVEAYKIKKQNKEKADEKVSDLHSGNTTADDILPKRKSHS